jgi:tetratricopeptide (TPR) repeat protein
MRTGTLGATGTPAKPSRRATGPDLAVQTRPAHKRPRAARALFGHREALRLSPRDALAYVWMTNAGLAKLHLGGWEQAVAWFQRAVEANRNNPHPQFLLAAVLAQLGRLEEAHSAVRVGLALNPTYTISHTRAAYTAGSDDATFLAQFEPIIEGPSRYLAVLSSL